MKKVTAVLIAFALAFVGSVACAQEKSDKAQVETDKAFAFLIDIEKTPGWMVYGEAGYQWNFFRGVGMYDSRGNRTAKRNYTESGMAGAIALGYNFCPKFPLTLGMKFGMGPSNLLEATEADGVTQHWQRIRLYTFDFALDYDFKNSSKFTPFVGLNAGGALVSHKAGVVDDGNGVSGKLDTKRSLTYMAGFRTGFKYDINQCVALTAFGQYSYLGKLKGRSFNLDDGSAVIRTNGAKMHMVEAKIGIRIAF